MPKSLIYKVSSIVVDNFMWIAITAVAHHTLRRLFSKGVPMLEGNEIEGELLNGAVKYAVDVKGDANELGKVASSIGGGIDQQFDIIKSIPGCLTAKVKLTGEVVVEGDVVQLAIEKLKGSTSPVAVFLSAQLSALRAGAEVHPAVLAAANEAVASNEQKA